MLQFNSYVTLYSLQANFYIDKEKLILYSEIPNCQTGEVSEWSKEAVLKTVEPQGSVGSNPTFSVVLVVGEVREWSNRAPC